MFENQIGFVRGENDALIVELDNLLIANWRFLQQAVVISRTVGKQKIEQRSGNIIQGLW